VRWSHCFNLDVMARGGSRLTVRTIARRVLLDPGYRVIVYYRLAMHLKSSVRPRRIFDLLGNLLLVRLARVPGVELFTLHEIGEGIFFAHPHDVVIGKGAKIGKNVTIYNGVTLGAKTLLRHDANKDVDERYPTIEDGVTIFPGAKLIGPITIGRNSMVGANSVVMESFPENSVVAGAPARLIRRT